MRTGRGLGVVLHRERRHVEQPDALGGHVVEVHVRELHAAEPLERTTGATPAATHAPRSLASSVEPAARLGDERADRAEVDAEAVVLARDLDPAGEQVHDRLVAAAVAVLELVGLRAHREREHLVPEADAEDRLLRREVAQRP